MTAAKFVQPHRWKTKAKAKSRDSADFRRFRPGSFQLICEICGNSMLLQEAMRIFSQLSANPLSCPTNYETDRDDNFFQRAYFETPSCQGLRRCIVQTLISCAF